MLRSGDILVRVTLTMTPCVILVWLWKICASSFCISRATRFFLVSCIIYIIRCGLAQVKVFHEYVLVEENLCVFLELLRMFGCQVVDASAFGAFPLYVFVAL